MTAGKLNHHNTMQQADERPMQTTLVIERIEQERHDDGIHSTITTYKTTRNRRAVPTVIVEVWTDRLCDERMFHEQTFSEKHDRPFALCVDMAKEFERCIREGWRHGITEWEQSS